VDDLLGEVDLEVAHHAAAVVAPAADGGEVGILEELAAREQRFVQRAAAPVGEEVGVAVMRGSMTVAPVDEGGESFDRVVRGMSSSR
jgi:hypothetical protein